MEPCYVGYYNRRVAMDGPTGPEARSIFGDRSWGTVGRSDFDWTTIGQVGSQDRHDVAAYEVVTETGVNLPDMPMHPRLGVHLDLASGGRRDDGTVRTFEPLNFSSIYSTEAPLLAPTNLMDMGMRLSASVLPKVRVQGIVSAFWKYAKNDYIYNFINAAYANTNKSKSTYVGIQPALRAGWVINRHLTMVGQLAWFNAGQALVEAHGKNQEYYATYLLFRF